MRITIIGSTGLIPQMYEHKAEMEKRGHKVMMPTFDNQAETEKELLAANKSKIEWAEQVHLLWDGRSPGTILDIGITIGLAKPLAIIYLEKKSIPEIVKQYAELWENETF